MNAISLIGFAVILDGLDGPLARLWNCTSVLGGYFDSQADLISFGLAPAVVVYFSFFTASNSAAFMLLAPFTLAVAIRLAIFNKKMAFPTERDGKSFSGMPAIAAAGVFLVPVVAVNALHNSYNFTAVMPLIGISCGVLMITPLPFPRPPLTEICNKYSIIALLCGLMGLIAYYLQPWLTSISALVCYAFWTAWTWIIQILRRTSQLQFASGISSD